MRRGDGTRDLPAVIAAVACVASALLCEHANAQDAPKSQPAEPPAQQHHGHGAGTADTGPSAKKDAASPASPANASQGSTPPLTGAAAPLDDLTATSDQRMVGLQAFAAEVGAHPLVALMSRAKAMPMRDLRVRQYVALAATLGEGLPRPVPPDIASALLAQAADASSPAAQIIAIRAIDAIPESDRPEGSAPFAVRRIAMATVPSRMVYDTTEFSVTASTPVCITMSNPDTMQHNLLVVAPRALSEIGIAGDKMGETAAGKACHFTPDSPKVLAVMGLVDPGATGEVWFVAPAKPATYPYVCTYPGHWRMMNGKMKVTASTTPKGDSSP